MPTETNELPPRYAAADVQREVAAVWESERLFHAEPTDAGEPFSVVIPPPNVTAALHLGHALNNTVQDILVRRARMAGRNAVWIPGTDHAGIATQAVVEKRLQQSEGKRRTDYTREEFVARVQSWKDEYEQTILGQLKAMGCSCDFERTAFTMDEQRARAVREAFFRLFKDGLIYRGKRLVNWDPVTQTALADDEVENEEIDGNFYYLRYPLENAHQGEDVVSPASAGVGDYVIVATTRPETMLGDTAVAINPRDPRAASLRGKMVKLPIVNRRIPIVEDDYVVMPGDEDDPKAKFATGFLKVTPAHDQNDWDIGQRHGLEVINVMAPDASISGDHGWTPETDAARAFVGLSREDARKAVVRWFKDNGLLEEVRPYRHSVGHSYRSHVPIEPYLSDQWYIAVQKPIPWMADEGVVEGTTVPKNSLAGLALTALDARHDREGVRSPQAMSGTPTPDPPDPAQLAPPTYESALAFFISFATKGTRLHGDERGSVDRGHNAPGTPLLPADPDRRAAEADQSAGPPVTLDEPARRAVHEAIVGVCVHRGWHLHALHVRTSHVHAVVSADVAPERVMNDFKSYATRRLREGSVAPAQVVWTRHGSTRWIKEPASIAAAVEYVVERQGTALEPAPFDARHEADARHDREGVRPPQAVSGSVSGSGPPDARVQTPAPPVALPDGRASQPSQSHALTFVPDRYAKTFHDWNAGLRDWCISRQLWWGHRIPVWTRLHVDTSDGLPLPTTREWFEQRGMKFMVDGTTDTKMHLFRGGEFVDLDAPEDPNAEAAVDALCTLDRHLVGDAEEFGFAQDPDVLDTWFSSALWPMSTLGWPDRTPSLEEWNPTSVLCTAREIITLWVSRMVMFNRYLLAHPDEKASAARHDREGVQSPKAMSGPADAGATDDDRTRAAPVVLPDGRASPSSAGPVPFETVFIHAMIQDGYGQKMSKSLGNGVDPLDIIATHGADAMRFTLAQMTTHTQDVRLPVEAVDPHTGETFVPETFVNKDGYTVFKPVQVHQGKKSVSSYGVATGEATPTPDVPAARNTSAKFDLGRNFCNKLWNAGRFVISNLGTHHGGTEARRAETSVDEQSWSVVDRWILSRLARTVEAANKALDEYRFDRYATACYDFFWRDFCDWYVEAAKPVLRDGGSQAEQTRHVLATCLDVSLRLMHPAIPFATERLWWALNDAMPKRGIPGRFDCPPSERCIRAAWPTAAFGDGEAENEIEQIQSVVEAIRRVRTEHKVPPRMIVPISVKNDLQGAGLAALQLWAGCEIKPQAELRDFVTTSAASATIYIGGVIDPAAEAGRLAKERADLEKKVKTLQGRLANKGYTDKAPPHLVQQTRDELASAEAELAKL